MWSLKNLLSLEISFLDLKNDVADEAESIRL